jgi:type IV pilus assembly protein PilN
MTMNEVNINLRPWRRIKRAKIKKEYTQQLIVLGLGAIIFMGCVYQYYKGSIQSQQARNNYLIGVEKEMNSKIAEIAELQKQKADILNRMTIINSLQGDRKITVKVLDNLNVLTPKGITLTLLSRTDNKFKFEGVTGQNNDISEFLANLQTADFFVEPKLGKINIIEDTGKKTVKELLINQQSPDRNKFFITATQKEQ